MKHVEQDNYSNFTRRLFHFFHPTQCKKIKNVKIASDEELLLIM